MKQLLLILLLFFPVSCSEKETEADKISKAMELCADRWFLRWDKLPHDDKLDVIEGEIDFKLSFREYYAGHSYCEEDHSKTPKTFMKRWGN